MTSQIAMFAPRSDPGITEDRARALLAWARLGRAEEDTVRYGYAGDWKRQADSKARESSAIDAFEACTKEAQEWAIAIDCDLYVYMAHAVMDENGNAFNHIEGGMSGATKEQIERVFRNTFLNPHRLCLSVPCPACEHWSRAR